MRFSIRNITLPLAIVAALWAGTASAANGGTNVAIKSAAGGGKFCWDAKGGSGAEGNQVFLWECGNNKANQRWTFTHNATGDSTIVGIGGMCIDVKKGLSSPGTPIELWDCHFGNNQRFKLEPSGEIREPSSGLCLQALKEGAGGPIVLSKCAGHPTEKWLLQP